MADTYQYKVRDRTGNVTSGSLVADSEALVLARLREQGLTPLDVKRQKRGIGQIEFGGKKVKLKQVAIFSRQFATMVNSGLPILRALSILSDQTENKELSRVLGEARLDVEQGASLSGALAKHDHVFNNLYISMVRAGETGGSLDSTLVRLAEMIEGEVKLRGKIKSAMTYPVAVVALVLLIMSAMLLFVVPQFESIYASLDAKLPLPTRSLLFVSDIFKTYWYMFFGSALAARFFFRRWKKTEAGREMVDSIKLRVPVFGSLFHRTALSRFSSTLAMLLRSGVPILQALEIVSETVNNKVIGKAITDVQLSVRDGESIAKPLSKHGVFPPMVVQMISVGEETGQVDTMLEKIAQFYDQEVEAAVDALTSLIEPILIAFIGGAVGAAVVALYLPMFQVIEKLQ
ncbi:MAG TPA: type II secretion system F family protein [Actinomycetota bacterium]|nr:type II secretion system F family protein [Actinomycetota bacterium]